MKGRNDTGYSISNIKIPSERCLSKAQYGKTSKHAVDSIVGEYAEKSAELRSGLEILQEKIDNANKRIEADSKVKLGSYENDFYRRISDLISTMSENIQQSIAHMSIYNLKIILRACNEYIDIYPELHTITSCVSASLRLKLEYFYQYKDVQSKVDYWHLIENMQWPFYACDALDMESEDCLRSLYQEAHNIAGKILKGNYLPGYKWVTMDKEAVYRKQFYALKSLELGFISVKDFENFILAYAVVLDNIEYPGAKIKVKLSDLSDVEEDELKYLLCNTCFNFTDEMYQQFLLEAKKLPVYKRKILQINFKTNQVPSMYFRVSNAFMGPKQRSLKKSENCILPADIFDLVRNIYFKDTNLTRIKRVLGSISTYQIAVDAKKNIHVVNYNFPGQPILLHADGYETGHTYFPLHDRDYHVLVLDTIPENIRAWLKWLYQKLIEAGIQLNDGVDDRLFTYVDCNFYYFKYVYAEIKASHPEWTRQQIYKEMQKDLYRHLEEVLCDIMGNGVFSCQVKNSYNDEMFAYMDQFPEKQVQPILFIIKGMRMNEIYYIFPVNDPKIAKAELEQDEFLKWKNESHYFSQLFEILKQNRAEVLDKFGIDTEKLVARFSYNDSRSFGSQMVNKTLQTISDQLTDYRNLFFTNSNKTVHYSPLICSLRINSKNRRKLNKEIVRAYNEKTKEHQWL